MTFVYNDSSDNKSVEKVFEVARTTDTGYEKFYLQEDRLKVFIDSEEKYSSISLYLIGDPERGLGEYFTGKETEVKLDGIRSGFSVSGTDAGFTKRRTQRSELQTQSEAISKTKNKAFKAEPTKESSKNNLSSFFSKTPAKEESKENTPVNLKRK